MGPYLYRIVLVLLDIYEIKELGTQKLVLNKYLAFKKAHIDKELRNFCIIPRDDHCGQNGLNDTIC